MQSDFITVALITANVVGKNLGPHNVWALFLTWCELDINLVVPCGDGEPVAIDNGLVLYTHGVHGPAVLAKANHQLWRRN